MEEFLLAVDQFENLLHLRIAFLSSYRKGLVPDYDMDPLQRIDLKKEIEEVDIRINELHRTLQLIKSEIKNQGD